MEKQEKAGPITSYDEYLRRYLPDEAVERWLDVEDPAEVGEAVGREAVERAVARLTTEDAGQS